MKAFIKAAAVACGIVAGTVGSAAAQTTLKFSHHFPNNPNDFRSLLGLAFADELSKANVGLTVTIYPDQSLVRAKEQWEALSRGTIDLSAFSMAELAGPAEFQVLGMPAVIKDRDHAKRLEASPFMGALKALSEKSGVVILDSLWLVGAIGSAKGCIERPDDLVGLAARTSSKALDQVFESAGALTVAMPSSELSKGLTTGAIDALTLPAATMATMKMHDQLKCVTLPGAGALNYVHLPIMVSKVTWDKLTPDQQTAAGAAAAKAAQASLELVLKAEKQVAEDYAKAGATIKTLDTANFAAWRALAEKTAWTSFEKMSPEAGELMRLMKAID
ncbi:MAG TPA: TRAP transporter substrate-binding protein DctP [Azospirillaceae bacterium]|nr:TRAP transporter substrate-binding protein DctP [Azospirillaceae bacterium]